MEKRKPKKEGKPRKDAVQKAATTEKKAEIKEEEDKLDFGGLPNRDLKKNLGCG